MFALGSLHCALASGAVYCNRSCLCVCMFVAGGRCPRARSVWVSLSAFFIVRLWRSRRSRTVVFWRLAVKREVARRRLLPPLTPRTGHAPPVRKPNPNLNQRPPRALFCLKLYNSCCHARYSCGNNCNVVVKLVQEYHCFFIHFNNNNSTVKLL